ncbi:ABC transporter permease [Pontibacter ramchanderi]|uniref:Putative ABC transport system permease protein n=1 Tax=Pontibacter ramchanderi TaxID=1179743 RepID=A0A2N3V3D4_9BACT|nr:FtsX-like permease family protein [Pontibacter ramchanderi]PKV76145.1 putative ABC transport system permease protein [Pontibacter ramchanderi]
MIRHLFKLIWNRKKSNFLLISEIFFCFLVLFAVLSLVVYNVRNYSKPLGFDYDNVWLLTARADIDSTELRIAVEEQLTQKIRSYGEVEGTALVSSNSPFAFSQMKVWAKVGDGPRILAENLDVEDTFAEVMQLNVSAGRWFTKQDDAARYNPVVINRVLQQELFGDESAIGKLITRDDSSQVQVIGVVDHYRGSSEYAEESPVIFTRINQQREAVFWGEILIRVKPGTGIAFEERMVKDLSGIAKNWTLELTTVEKMRQNKEKLSMVPMIAMAVVCGFLIFNVALGLFGVLWYNISRRNGEIGLRRALGASANQVYRQFIGEVLVLATFGLVLGVAFAIQFPMLQVFEVESMVYFIALGIAVGLIYLLAIGCAFYPSRQAAAIHPAMALHEE